MNASPVRRRWFQLHLSTLIAFVILLGGALYLNIYVQNQNKYDARKPGQLVLISKHRDDYPNASIDNGWPYSNLTRIVYVDGDFVEEFSRQWHFPNMAVNIALAFCGLAATVFVFESIARRRKQVPRE